MDILCNELQVEICITLNELYHRPKSNRQRHRQCGQRSHRETDRETKDVNKTPDCLHDDNFELIGNLGHERRNLLHQTIYTALTARLHNNYY